MSLGQEYFRQKISSIIPTVVLPTTEIIELEKREGE